jgi:hypothetical protein
LKEEGQQREVLGRRVSSHVPPVNGDSLTEGW